MKKMFVLAVAVAFSLLGASAALAAVAGGPHDLRTGTGFGVTAGAGGDEICVHCHTPHGSAQAALFNRVAGAGNVGTNYCRACHDGTFTNLINVPGRGFAGSAAQPTYGGTPLNDVWDQVTGVNNHPLGAGPLATGFTDPANAAYQQTQTQAGWMTGTSTVECASCHDPHNETFGLFLRQTNVGSAICLQCHIK